MPLTLQQALCIDAAVTEKTTCRFGVCLLSSEGISVRLHPPAFTNRRLSVGYKSLAVFVTAFYSIALILCLSSALVNPVFPLSVSFLCFFPVFPLFFAAGILDKQNGPCYLFRHIINAMTMLRIPHRFQRAGGRCEPAAGRKCGLPSEQNGRKNSRLFRPCPVTAA